MCVSRFFGKCAKPDDNGKTNPNQAVVGIDFRESVLALSAPAHISLHLFEELSPELTVDIIMTMEMYFFSLITFLN